MIECSYLVLTVRGEDLNLAQEVEDGKEIL
jgi:hypothetical protein